METVKSIIKYAAIFAVVVLALIIVFVLGYAFLPDIFDPAVARLKDLFESIPAINIQDSQFINFNMDFELPKFEFNFNGDIGGGAEDGIRSFHFSGWMIIAGIIAIIFACLHPYVGAIVTIVFSVLGGYLSVQTVGVYRELVANGTTTWKAAGSCFWPLFAIFSIVFVGGLVTVLQTLFKDDNIVVRILATTIMSVIVAAIASLIVTLLTLLVLGLGWAGGVYFFLAVSIIISALLAVVTIVS